MMTMRGNARGRKEEVHMMIGDEGVGEDNYMMGDDDRQINTTIKGFTGEGLYGDGDE